MALPCWETLPQEILCYIFWHLDYNDRFNASLVCSTWSQAFHCPELWKHLYFECQGKLFTKSERRALEIAERYGNYVKYLTIGYHKATFAGRRIVQKHLCSLLYKLTGKCQLFTFKMPQLFLHRDWRMDKNRNKILNSVVRFLKSQNSLVVVDLCKMDISAIDGIRILESLSYANCFSLKELHLKDFFHTRQAVYRHEAFNKTIIKFVNLKSLSFNYSCVSNELFITLSTTLAGKLEDFSIKCRRFDIFDNSISNKAWFNLKSACPSLLVEYYIDQVPQMETLEKILPPDLPLRSLMYWSGFLSEEEESLMESATFVRYINTHFENTIESLALELMDFVNELDTALEMLLVSCKKLIEFDLTAILPTTFVENLCLLALDELTTVRRVFLILCATGTSEADEIKRINKFYQPLLEDIGVTYHLHADFQI